MIPNRRLQTLLPNLYPKRRLAGRFKFRRSWTISVVVPTLNEEAGIGSCISGICSSPHVCEVIVADGGSKDKTVDIAHKAGAVVVVHDRPYHSGGGRGGQIRAGIMRASGDVVVIVHADTFVPPKAFRRIIRTLNSQPSLIGGAVGCRFHDINCANDCSFSLPVNQSSDSISITGIGLKIIEFLNDARAVFFDLSFGDQVQFFRREPVVCYDLFPDMPLMEDVEFSIRLRSLGRQVFLFEKALVSARRWKRTGFRNIALVIWLLISYITRRLFTGNKKGGSGSAKPLFNTPDTALFYRKYYTG